MSNFRLNSENNIIVGHSLVYDCSTVEPGTVKEEMGAWLRRKFWDIAVQMLFDGNFKLTDWNSLSSTPERRCLRPLLNFACYDSKDLKMTSERLEKLWRRLRYPQCDRQYTDIRKAIMDMEDIDQDFVYRPADSVTCAPGDVGYFREGHFYVLDTIPHSTSTESTSYDEAYYGVFPSEPEKYIQTEIGEKKVRHRFIGGYANIRRRGVHSFLSKKRSAWIDFIRTARSLVDKFGDARKITASNLVLITGIEHDLRISYAKRMSSNIMTPIEFVEHLDPDPNVPWGYWEDRTNLDIMDDRCLQNIFFFQLEPGDTP